MALRVTIANPRLLCSSCFSEVVLRLPVMAVFCCEVHGQTLVSMCLTVQG